MGVFSITDFEQVHLFETVLYLQPAGREDRILLAIISHERDTHRRATSCTGLMLLKLASQSEDTPILRYSSRKCFVIWYLVYGRHYFFQCYEWLRPKRKTEMFQVS